MRVSVSRTRCSFLNPLDLPKKKDCMSNIKKALCRTGFDEKLKCVVPTSRQLHISVVSTVISNSNSTRFLFLVVSAENY